MTTSVYPTYRAAGRPIELLGLKGQYILIAAAGLIADFLLFVILYCCGTPPWLCILIAFGLGAAAIAMTRSLSQRFGACGLTKYWAAKQLPSAIRIGSRQPFLSLLNL